jgi:ribose 5-phosphate isomerase A
MMDLREGAAEKALDFVQNGMILGLGTGRTAACFIKRLGDRLRSGDLKDIRAVPTSEATRKQTRDLGIPLVSLSDYPCLDLAVDSADEVDPKLDLIKGLGRALLREKVVETHAQRFLVIVDETKVVPYLGYKTPLPVEIIPFEWGAHVLWLNSLGCRAELWREEDGSPAITENGNYLARCWFQGGVSDGIGLAEKLARRPGIVEHGLFLDMADAVIVAAGDGVRVMERASWL